MKKNVGQIDQIVRAVVGLALLLIGFLVPMTSVALQIILVVLGVFLLVTAALSYCPIYTLAKFSTRK